MILPHYSRIRFVGVTMMSDKVEIKKGSK